LIITDKHHMNQRIVLLFSNLLFVIFPIKIKEIKCFSETK